MIINKKKNYKKIFIISLIIILLFLITITLIKHNENRKKAKMLEEETARIKSYTALTDFKSIEEVAIYLNCKFIKQEDSKRENINYDIYMILPVQYNNESADNKNFTENLIQFSAYVLKYKNFVIIDEEHSTSILVMCNEEKQLVSTYYINNIENYFDVIQNRQNAKSYKPVESIDNMDVTSEQLTQLIVNNWNAEKVDFGTKESNYRNYDIYFDEGIQVRKVAGKVFNIIFTDKYESTIVNDLKTTSTIDEIKQSLGKPQFENGNLIGYKDEKIYIFFCDNQVSVYRVEQYDTEDIAKIIQNKSSKNENEKVFVDEIRKTWKDSDIYEFDENNVKLQYTLKGLCIKYDSTTQKGVIVYNNYKGKLYGDKTLEEMTKEENIPSHIFIQDKDLVFQEEQNRLNTLDDTTSSNNYSKTGVINNTSNEFKTYKKAVNKDGDMYLVRFISIGNKYPNTELREYITCGIWADDYNFIYSVKGRGIYVYNAKDRKYKTVLTGNGTYQIQRYSNNTLYYDGTEKAEINLD